MAIPLEDCQSSLQTANVTLQVLTKSNTEINVTPTDRLEENSVISSMQSLQKVTKTRAFTSQNRHQIQEVPVTEEYEIV